MTDKDIRDVLPRLLAEGDKALREIRENPVFARLVAGRPLMYQGPVNHGEEK